MKETEKERNKYVIIVAILFSAVIVLFGFIRSCWNDVTVDLEKREKERLTHQFTNALTHGQREQIIRQVVRLNGEIVVNGAIIDAPKPYFAADTDFLEGTSLLARVIVPLQPIAEALGYEIFQLDVLPPIISVGNASFTIGSTEVRIDRNPTFEFLLAPYVNDDGVIFVPLNFFRDALGKTIYIFEGQVVVETDSDMR